MALTDDALDAMGDELASLAGFLALHTSDPGSTGANESAAARVAATWTTAANGEISLTSAASFTGGTSDGPVTHVGLWSAPNAGTFYGAFALTGDTQFNNAGEYTVNDVTISGS